LSQDDIEKLVKSLDEEVKNIKSNALRLSWYMRGSLSYTDAMNLSPTETQLINQLIDDNLETTKKSGLPFF